METKVMVFEFGVLMPKLWIKRYMILGIGF